MFTSLCAIVLFVFATIIIARDELRARRAPPRTASNAKHALRAIGGMYSHAHIRGVTSGAIGTRPLRSEHAANTAMRGHELYRATCAAMKNPSRK